MGKGKINIRNVNGDIVIGSNQTKSITANTSNATPQSIKKRSWKKIGGIFAGLASVVTILAYLGFSPQLKTLDKQPSLHTDTRDTPIVSDQNADQNPTKASKVINKDQKKKDPPVSIGDVSGDIVISQNQSGGITAHTVIVDKPLPRELNAEDQEVLISLDKGYLVSVIVIAGSDTKRFSEQIINFLQSNGYKTQVDYVGQLLPEAEPGRYHLDFDPVSKTIHIVIPKEGINIRN